MTASLLWNGASTATLVLGGVLSKMFLRGAQRVEVEGVERFAEFMNQRKQGGLGCDAGVVTVSNHISVLDDPLMWGTLPIRNMLSRNDLRWGLGSHDICFTTRSRSLLFSLGQIIPTHRLHKSPEGLGGLFQPAIDHSVKLLSRSIRPQWVHVFPEGRVHQHQTYQMRYFKWGVSRLLLEPPIPPTFAPMFIEGFSDIMHESRGFPRFLPRVGKRVKVTFGEPFVGIPQFKDVRQEWMDLCEDAGYTGIGESGIMPEVLKTSENAVQLRIETARRVREEVVTLRRGLGWPEEEDSAGLAETYRSEGMTREGKTEQGAWEKDA